MTKLFKKISAALISLIFLLNMSSAGMADTTVSAEVGFIFNTFLFLICGFLVMFMAAGFNVRVRNGYIKKCIRYLCKKYRFIFNCRNYVLDGRL